MLAHLGNRTAAQERVSYHIAESYVLKHTSATGMDAGEGDRECTPGRQAGNLAHPPRNGVSTPSAPAHPWRQGRRRFVPPYEARLQSLFRKRPHQDGVPWSR